MAYAGATTGAATAVHTSSYRVKYKREEFLKLVQIASPDLIYKVRKVFFFAYDGFVMYTFECDEEDFINQNIIRAIEFSNTQWGGP